MNVSNFKLAPLAVAALSAGVGMAMSGNASAEAYAISYNHIFNFTVSHAPLGSANFIFPNTVASNTAATLSGFAGCALGDTGSLADAGACNLGAVAKAENDFTPEGNVGGNYSRSDSQIVSEQAPAPGTAAQALNIAESRISTTGAGTAGSNVASDTSFIIPFFIAGPTSLTFDFFADPYLQVVLLNSGLPPSVARASIDATINITNLGTGDDVFSWAPNGVIGEQGSCAAGQGTIAGGCETLDGANLNRQIVRNFGLNGTTTADPTGGAIADVGDLTPSTFASFNAFTNLLADGEYLLTLRFGSRTEVERVPEPNVLALLGLGLMGLAFARRRKQA